LTLLSITVTQVKNFRKMGLLSRFAIFVRWYPKDMPIEEQRLVSKIDFLVLVYACLAFFTKYLDISALSKHITSELQLWLLVINNMS
jgi:ACS family pantothenate transporter-like MFS transporter